MSPSRINLLKIAFCCLIYGCYSSQKYNGYGIYLEDCGILGDKPFPCVVDEFQTRLNTRANPCDDFFEYACGGFVKNVKYEYVRAQDYVDSEKIMESETERVLHDILEQKVSKLDAVEAYRKVRKYYQICLYRPNTNRNFVNKLKEAGGLPALQKTWKEMSYANIISRARKLVDFKDMMLCPAIRDGRKGLELIEGHFLLRDALIEGDVIEVNHYRTLMIETLDVLKDKGVAKADIIKDVDEVMAFQRAVAVVKAGHRGWHDYLTNMTIAEVWQMAPSINWPALTNGYSDNIFPLNTTIWLSIPNYVKEVSAIIGKTKNRTLANYVLWTAIHGNLKNLGVDVLKIYAAYKGYPDSDERHRRKCFTEVVFDYDQYGYKEQGYVLYSMFAKLELNRKKRNMEKDFIADVLNSFTSLLSSQKWLSSKSKASAMNKILNMKIDIGYEDKLLNVTLLNDILSGLTVTDDYAENLKSDQLLEQNRPEYDTRKALYIQENIMNRRQEHKNYYASYNTIYMNPSFLQDTMFLKNRPYSMNVGALGAYTGESIAYGFDSKGKRKDNWSKYSTTHYNNTFECFPVHANKLYSGLDYENLWYKMDSMMRDNAALVSSYVALDEYLPPRDSCKVNSDFGYTERQLFWLAYAQDHCGKSSSDYKSSQTKYGEWLIHNQRVNFNVQNMKEFSTDFHCKKGDKMNPDNKCIGWSW